MSAATTSKAEAFGAGLARAVKSLVLAERRLVAGAGSKGHLVKWGLLAFKLLVAGLLLATTLWAVVVLLPVAIAFFALSRSSSVDSSRSSSLNPWTWEAE